MESERKLERYQYAPGAFLFEGDRGGDTPVADDRGAYRTDDARASSLAQSRLDAARDGARIVTFETSAADLAPGSVVSILDHPRTELAGFDGMTWPTTSQSNSIRSAARCTLTDGAASRLCSCSM